MRKIKPEITHNMEIKQSVRHGAHDTCLHSQACAGLLHYHRTLGVKQGFQQRRPLPLKGPHDPPAPVNSAHRPCPALPHAAKQTARQRKVEHLISPGASSAYPHTVTGSLERTSEVACQVELIDPYAIEVQLALKTIPQGGVGVPGGAPLVCRGCGHDVTIEACCASHLEA